MGHVSQTPKRIWALIFKALMITTIRLHEQIFYAVIASGDMAGGERTGLCVCSPTIILDSQLPQSTMQTLGQAPIILP